MNNWYCSVFTREDTSQVPEAAEVFQGNDTLEDMVITRDRVKKKLLALKPKSAPGPDKISPAVMQSMADVLSGPLTRGLFQPIGNWQKLLQVSPGQLQASQSDLFNLQGDGGTCQG